MMNPRRLHKLCARLEPALSDRRRSVIWLFGNRSTGKTTLANQIVPFAEGRSIHILGTDWTAPASMMLALRKPGSVIVEYQKFDSLFETMLVEWQGRKSSAAKEAHPETRTPEVPRLDKTTVRFGAAMSALSPFYLAYPVVVICEFAPPPALLSRSILVKCTNGLLGFRARILSAGTVITGCQNLFRPDLT